MEEVEIWKDYNDKYKVSNLGRVWNKLKDRELKIYTDKVGYCRVSINGKSFALHRLVAITFLDNPENKPTVNHINAIKGDNRLINLEWATRQEQMNHVSENQLYPDTVTVVLIDEGYNIIEKFNSQRDCSLKLNVNLSTVFGCCNGFVNKSKNYKLRKLVDNEIVLTRFDRTEVTPKGEYKRKIYSNYNDKTYNTQMEVSKDLNVAQSVISRILLGKNKKNKYGIKYIN